ncbi:MAG: TonB-dependent receptor [Candidatus Kapaibacterium sp.]
MQQFKSSILKFLIMALAALAAPNAYAAAPEALFGPSLSGYVLDKESGETLVGASIFIVGTDRGAFTNKSGFFSVNGIPEGARTVRIKYVGYDEFEQKITFGENERIRRDFKLSPAAVESEGVSVFADREVEKREISVSKVNVPVSQIKQIRIGGESDVFRAIQMLPGVLTSSQISSGLYIRGGSPDQNLVLIDGSTVYNPSHLFGFVSAFNSNAIKDVDLIKGGYPAEFGGRLSSVLNITQKDGNREKYEGLVSLGMLTSKASAEGPLGNGAFFVSGRRTYIDLVAGLLPEDKENPFPDFGFYDINAKVSQNLGPNDRLYMSGFLSRDNFGIEQTGMNVGMHMGNRTGSLRWTHIFGDNLFSDVNFTASNYSNGMENSMSGWEMKIENSITDYTLKANMEWFVSNEFTFKSGIHATHYDFGYDQNWSGEKGDTEEGTSEGSRMNLKIRDYVYAAYAQTNYRATALLSLQAGLRVSHWDMSRKTNIDPRMSIRYQMFDNLALKLSWGIFHQYLRLAGDENISIFDTWLPTDNSVDPSKAIHYIFSAESRVFDDYELNFDAYYKSLLNISEVNMNVLEGKKVSDLFYSGNGEAYGIELFLQKKIGRLAGWVGYGLGWVNARFDSINGGAEFRPKYDRRHDFKIVLQYELDETWQFGATFQFQSGQSYTGANSRIQMMMPGMEHGAGLVTGTQRYGLRLPPSHQMNINVNYNTTVFGLPSVIALDIYNVYSRRDILMRFYDTREAKTKVDDLRLLPIIPSVSWEIKF